MKLQAAIPTLLGLVLLGTTARASGHTTAYATPIYTIDLTIPANNDYNLQVLPESLTGNEDTVMYVVYRITGAPIAFNDDCPGYAPSSCVNLARVNYSRDVTVIIRAKYAWSAGDAQLRYGGCSAQVCDYFHYSFLVANIWRFAGTPVSMGQTLYSGTRIMTVRQMPATGANDSVLVAESAGTSAAGYADEGGLHAPPENPSYGMTSTNLYTNCNYPCTIWVGTYGGSPEGNVGLLWDTGGPDADGDGFSDSLEIGFGANPAIRDTDGDGLNDGDEFYGVISNGESLQFSYWGADPLHKDVFVEADHGPGGGMTTAALDSVIAEFSNGDSPDRTQNPDHLGGVRVHVDYGGANVGTTYGNWGGAVQSVPANTGGCDPNYFSAGRHGYFRHTVVNPGYGGQAQAQNSPCMVSSSDQLGSTGLGHELGHSLNLDHGGASNEVGGCNPLYQSLMNYNGALATFSDDAYADVFLNPVGLNETAGVGSHSPSWLSTKYQFSVQGSAVDWNRDGRYDGAVRGAPNLVQGACEIGLPHRKTFSTGAQNAFLGMNGQQNYVFIVGNDGALRYSIGSSVLSCSSSTLSAWSAPCPGDFTSEVVVPGSINATGAGAAAGFVQPPINYPGMLAVYRESGGANRLLYQRWVQDGGGISGSGWRTPAEVDVALRGLPSSNIPTLVELGGDLHLFVLRSDQTVAEYLFDRTNGIFSYIDLVRLTSGTPIAATNGFGVTAGYEKASSRKLYGVYQPPTVGSGIQFARREVSGAWTVISSVWGIFPAQPSLLMPGISYIPFDGAVPDDGRFYITRTYSYNSRTVMDAMLTEGNDVPTASSRRLKVVAVQSGSALFFFTPLNYAENLSQTPLAATTNQTHSAVGVWNGVVNFLPFYDGISNVNLTDHADFSTFGRNAACGIRCLGVTGGTNANAGTANGCCPTGATGAGWDKDCDQAYARDNAFIPGSATWAGTASCRDM